jgi:hypothetical protein
MFFRGRGVRFWAVIITAASVIVLFAGSQIAHDRRQTVEWYTGFGQWLGALASFIAAGVALWIAVSDRRNNLKDRRLDAESAAEAQAALIVVKVADPLQGTKFRIDVRNYSDHPILDIEFEWAKYSRAPKAKAVPQLSHGPGRVLDHDRSVYSIWVDFIDESTKKSLIGDTFDNTYQEWTGPNLPDPTAVSAGVRFRDANGLRWRQDTEGTVTRL